MCCSKINSIASNNIRSSTLFTSNCQNKRQEKCGVWLQNKWQFDKYFTRINQFNFKAFNVSVYMQQWEEDYKKLSGYYPDLVQIDVVKACVST